MEIDIIQPKELRDLIVSILASMEQALPLQQSLNDWAMAREMQSFVPKWKNLLLVVQIDY